MRLPDPGVHQGFGFSPNSKVGYDFTPKLQAGIEYYAAYGDLGGIVSLLHNQQQQFLGVTDLNVSLNWEINMGAGLGTTSTTDHFIVEGIIGRRFSWGPSDQNALTCCAAAVAAGVSSLAFGILSSRPTAILYCRYAASFPFSVNYLPKQSATSTLAGGPHNSACSIRTVQLPH